MAEFGEGLSEGFDWDLIRDINWDEIKTFDQYQELVRARFPSFAWMLEHEDLGELIRKAVDEEWSPLVLQAQLEDTQWYSDRTESQRAWDIWWETTGEKDKVERIENSQQAIANEAANLGVTLGAQTLYDLTIANLRNGYTSQELTNQILSQGQVDRPGDIWAARTDVRNVAAQYMVSLDEGTVNDLAVKLFDGTGSQTYIEEYMRSVAKQRYASQELHDFIDQGYTLEQYFQPHQQRIAEMLGLAYEQVDLMDSKWREVTSGRNANGQVGPMTLDETERWIRGKDEFWQGKNGREEMYTLGRELMRHMGVF